MHKKTINCTSCEVRCDIIIRQTNYDNDDIEVEFCPICSCAISDMDSSYDWDDE